MYGFPLELDRCRGGRRPVPARPRTRGWARRCATGWASATPRSTWPRPDWSSTPGSSPASDRYRDWIAEYVGAWRERAAANGGLLPDNVGPGRHRRQPAGGPLVRRPLRLVLAARLVQRRPRRRSSPRWRRPPPPATTPTSTWSRPRSTTLIAHGKVMAFTEADSSLQSKWAAQLGPDVDTPTLHVPFRYDDSGWFDYNPMLIGACPVALWHHTASAADRRPAGAAARGRRHRLAHACGRSAARRRPGTRSPGSPSSPATTPATRSGSSPPRRPRSATGCARMDRYRGLDVPEADIHVWQQSNPVVTEALVQLTWGGPQVSTTAACSRPGVRYHDADARRPGLPPVGGRAGHLHRPGGDRRRTGQPRPRGRRAR